MPRIVELAQTSSDRQTKVAACELLHSLVLFCLGRGALGHDKDRFSMAPLYKKMFPSLLQLACDVEQVIIVCIRFHKYRFVDLIDYG